MVAPGAKVNLSSTLVLVRTLANMEFCSRVRKDSDVGKCMNINLIVAVLSMLRLCIPGALPAVPILVMVKIFSNRVERLNVFGAFFDG